MLQYMSGHCCKAMSRSHSMCSGDRQRVAALAAPPIVSVSTSTATADATVVLGLALPMAALHRVLHSVPSHAMPDSAWLALEAQPQPQNAQLYINLSSRLHTTFILVRLGERPQKREKALSHTCPSGCPGFPHNAQPYISFRLSSLAPGTARGASLNTSRVLRSRLS